MPAHAKDCGVTVFCDRGKRPPATPEGGVFGGRAGAPHEQPFFGGLLI